ncbi:MAG: TauD/TfdA family dioxygenase [Hyphomicrobiaceae bacterium]
MMSNEAPLAVRPLSFALGAEVRGVDLGKPLDGNLMERILELWDEHHVLLFRGNELTPQEIVAFAGAFGPLDNHDATPFYRLDDVPELMQVTNKMIGGKPSETRNTGRNWHSDYSYTSRPAAASALYCSERPSVGGDTMFCNMERAYLGLSNGMKKILHDLEAVYDLSLTAGIGERDPAKTAELRRLNPPIAHPAVRVHPRSNKKALYVSERASHFKGLTRDESQPLIKQLCAFATRPENVYRHQWQVGDLVMWDNRTSMHMALADFDPSEIRYMLRATLLGEPSGTVIHGDDLR